MILFSIRSDLNWLHTDRYISKHQVSIVLFPPSLPGESSSSRIADEDGATTEMLRISQAMFTMVNSNIFAFAVHTFSAETRDGKIKSVKRNELLHEQDGREKRENSWQREKVCKSCSFSSAKTIFLFESCSHTSELFTEPTPSNSECTRVGRKSVRVVFLFMSPLLLLCLFFLSWL